MDSVKEVRKVPSTSLQVSVFVFILLTTATILALISYFDSPERMVKIISLAVASFFGLGKFVIFVPVDFLNPYQLAMMVIYMDTAVAIIIVYNFHMLKRLYWIGEKLAVVQQDSYYLLKSNKWMYDFAIVGIVMFVTFPIAGTGAIGAAFLSSLLGFSRLVSIFWIFVGAILGSFGMAIGAVYFKAKLQTFLEHPVFFFSSLSVAIVLLLFCGWKMKKMVEKQKQLEKEADNE